jgi:SAM-dependent methyltransferase
MSQDHVNGRQAAYWTDVAGPHWVREQRLFDYMLAPFGDEAMRVLDPQSGERIVDVGCGTATTTLALAKRVGPAGHVHGVDLSPTMLEVARRVSTTTPNTSFAVGDAQTDRLASDALFDGVFSRFGVMFFGDPVAAFRNIADSVRSDGRLAFVCWQHEDRNEWMSLPAEAMRSFTPEPVLPPPNAPGPFAFADRDRVAGILREAGWIDVELASFAAPVRLGGGLGLDEALTQTMGMRPAQMLRQQVDDETFAKATAVVRGILAEHVVNNEVTFRGYAWIASARLP